MRTLVALVSFGLCASGAWADVGKEEVKKLLAAGLSEDVVLKYVAQHAPMATLSPEDIAELKAAGASDSLIKALLDASTATPSYNASPSYSDQTYVAPQETYVYSYPYFSYYAPYYPYYSFYFYPRYRYSYPYSYYYLHRFYFPPRTSFPFRATPPRYQTPPRYHGTPHSSVPSPQAPRGYHR